jgi:DNA-directed RNA polymerase specialized sigma24 family protein
MGTGRVGAFAAARRALQRQADEVALFPELAPTESPAERVERFDAESLATVQRWRDHAAHTWRRARRQLRSLPPEQRAAVMARWSNKFLPKQAHYLADITFTITRP